MMALAVVSAAPVWAQDAARPANPQRELVERGGLPGATTVKRPWGPEQATGAPDTQQAGDMQTAWASELPDGGPEWLRVGFARAVKAAEIRIRETFNPGAISKVTVMAAGKEEVVWEGQDPTREAPGTLVVQVPQEFVTDSVKIYVDSARVPGWNEIDAVELVGADGSRQWASSASASSTYAERTTGLVDDVRAARGPFAQFQGKQVIVHLDGDKTVGGVFKGVVQGFAMLEGPDGLTTLVVNMQKIVYVEVGP
jgi:hypothetical protein